MNIKDNGEINSFVKVNSIIILIIVHLIVIIVIFNAHAWR